MQATSAPEFDARGEVVALRTALSDVSALRRAKLERDEALRAERALRMRLARVDEAMMRVTQAVKGIVELHGGRVWAESSVGKGTTFFFTLPAVPASELAVESTPAPVGQAASLSAAAGGDHS